MKHSIRFLTAPALLAAALAPLTMSAQTPAAGEAYTAPARFVVTPDVVNENVPANTATIGAFGNSLFREPGGFEPVEWRSRWFARRDHPDRVYADNLDRYDTLREGFLDGARVRVYRVIDGEIVLVRDDQVAEDGHAASFWHGNDSRIVPAGQESYVFAWAGYNRPDVPYYFAVRAIDKNGNTSEPSNAVAVTRPAELGEGESGATERFRAPRNPGESEAPAAPRDFRAELQDDGTCRMVWEPVEADDLAGYVILRSDYPPQAHRGQYLQLAGTASAERERIREGDFVIVSKTFRESSRKKYHSNRVWDARRNNRDTLPAMLDFFPDENPEKTWRLAPHGGDTPVEEAGETYLELRLGEGVEHTFADYNHAGSAQEWYDVLDPDHDYVVEFWMKYEGPGEPEVTFSLNGLHADEVEPITFQPTEGWKKHRATFRVAKIHDSRRASQTRLRLPGPGTYSIDNYRVYRADTGYLDYLPRDYARIAESGMISLRTHGPIKTGINTYGMEQFTNPGGVLQGIRKGNTLPQQFKMMHKAGVIPWLQIEMHMAPEEWLGFVEYIAASYDPAVDTPEDKPWAHKRYSQGQHKPWTDEFEQIWFEISNETWNWLFSPWVFEAMPDAATGESWPRGKVYGLFQEYVRDTLRSSPYWNAELDAKFEFMLGGWRNQNYSEHAAQASPHSRHVMQAAYNGGWDEGEGPPTTTPPSYFNVLAQVNQTAGPAAIDLLAKVEEASAMHGNEQFPGTYEAGPGYALNGLNNARVTPEQARMQEEVMKSLTGGTATLDSFLIRSYYGHKLQNFFTFSEGRTWSSHTKWYRGGQAYPCWKVLEVFNKHGTGDFLRTETVSVPTVDLAQFKRRRAVEDAPLTAVYASREGNRVTLFVLSRKIPNYPVEGDDGYTPVTVELPFTRCESIRIFRMAGDHTAHNIYADNVGFESATMPGSRFEQEFAINRATGADERGLPPASTFIYVFEGTNMPDGERVPTETLLGQAR